MDNQNIQKSVIKLLQDKQNNKFSFQGIGLQLNINYTQLQPAIQDLQMKGKVNISQNRVIYLIRERQNNKQILELQLQSRIGSRIQKQQPDYLFMQCSQLQNPGFKDTFSMLTENQTQAKLIEKKRKNSNTQTVHKQ